MPEATSHGLRLSNVQADVTASRNLWFEVVSGGADATFDRENKPIRRTGLAKNLLGLFDCRIGTYVFACHNNGRNLP
jgi:hypothetical protein